jgi:ribonuclease HI
MSGPTEIWTDGACEPNPGHGGWGFVIPSLGFEKNGGESDTTNNRMEMRAIVEALRHSIGACPGHAILIRSDSILAMNVISGKWKGRVNKDLIEEARALMKGRRIGFQWVKGHSGNKWNERADKLASIGRKQHIGDRTRRSPQSAPSLDGIEWRQW